MINIHLSIMMLLNAAELAVINTMFCLKFERRQKFGLRCALCAILVLAYIFFGPLESMFYFIHLPILAASFFYIWVCYQTDIVTTLFLGIAGYTVQHIASLLNSLATCINPELFSHFGTDTNVGVYGYLLIFACDALVLTAAYFAVVKRLQLMELHRNATASVVALTGVMLVMNQAWGVFYEIFGMEYNESIYAVGGYVWNLICCVLSLGLQFGIFGISQRDKELEITKKLIADKERQYKVSKSMMDAINRKCHDLKYQLAALSTGQDSQKHINDAMELVDSFDSAIHTGNETLDIIFTEKNSYCKKHDITFVCMIDGGKLGFMDAVDQYVMFGNLIDNAINAVRKIEDHAKRSIYINIRAEKKLLLIQTENPFVGELTFEEGLPKTTTGDEFNHGFGMSSIRLIAEKYQGSVNTRADNGIFYLNIVLPI